MVGLKTVDYWSADQRKNGIFRPSHFQWAMYENPMGHNQFQNILRRVAKFHKNRLRDVENFVAGKKELECWQLNVSFPNLTVAHLEEHFPPPQRRNRRETERDRERERERERQANVGLTKN